MPYTNILIRHIIILKLGIVVLFICFGIFLMLSFSIKTPSGNGATGAIAGGVAAGAALLFAAPAIALALWRKRKPQDHFFDVPG